MLVEVTAVTGLGGAVGILAVGATAVRRYDEPGVAWFAGYAALVGGALALLNVGVLAGVVGVTEFTGPIGQWLALVWILSATPWAAFAVRYTGRFVPLTLRTGALVAAPFLVVGLQVVVASVSTVPAQILGLFGLTVRYYALTLTLAGAVLVVRATRRYEHVTVWQGVALAATPVSMWLFWGTMTYFAQIGRSVGGVAYAAGSLGAACGLGFAVFWFDAFEATPAVGVVGERDAVNETDDIVLVADDEHRVVRANESARTVSDASNPSAGPATVEGVIGSDVDDLRAAETVELDVAGTSEKYDPQVSTVVDRRDRRLGTVISLREVTDRELRKERLAVLNRVLRHNLRNQLDVVNAQLEPIDDERAVAAADAATRIAHMSDRARTIDRLLSETRERVAIDVAELLRDVVAPYDASVAVDVPGSLVVTTDRVALEAAVESAVDNAVTHATGVRVSLRSTPEGCEVRVADDGPGIPDSELSALESGTETPLRHGTGLGLWQLTWAARALGERPSFDTSDGTTVTISVPDASADGGGAV